MNDSVEQAYKLEIQTLRDEVERLRKDKQWILDQHNKAHREAERLRADFTMVGERAFQAERKVERLRESADADRWRATEATRLMSEFRAKVERLEKHFLWEQDSTIPVCPNEREVERLQGQVGFFERTMVPEEDLRVMTDEVERLRAENEQLKAMIDAQRHELAVVWQRARNAPGKEAT
jgi:hypothetical protein